MVLPEAAMRKRFSSLSVADIAENTRLRCATPGQAVFQDLNFLINTLPRPRSRSVAGSGIPIY